MVDEFVDLVAAGFEPEYSAIVTRSGPETDYAAITHEYLNKPSILILKHGWVRDQIDLKIAQPGHTTDWFLNEWLYTRPMIGRGGRHIVTPHNLTSDELEAESLELTRYAMKCRYNIVKLPTKSGPPVITVENSDHEERETNWDDFVIDVRRSALVGIERVGAYHYVGPRHPRVTFVGDWVRGIYSMPFVDPVSAEYFRQLGPDALYEFGYMRPESVGHWIPRRLRRKIITVGNRAHALYPQYPNIPGVEDDPTRGRLAEFYKMARIALAQYKETTHDGARVRWARKSGQNNPHQRNGSGTSQPWL